MFNTITPRLFREPITAGTAALVTAGAQLLGTGATAYAQGRMNKKTRQWNEKMYSLQRSHNLQDWATQNEYNSPKMQIQRMREAGLNPALMYKGGSGDVTAGPIRSADAPSWSPQAPRFDNLGNIASNGLSTYMDMQMKKQTLDNLTQQNTILKQDQLLKQAQTTQILANTESTKQNTLGAQFDLKMKNALSNNQLQVAEQNLRATIKQKRTRSTSECTIIKRRRTKDTKHARTKRSFKTTKRIYKRTNSQPLEGSRTKAVGY